MSRRRPLHTCGTSFLAVIHATCRKAQELNGPLGKWANVIIKFMSLALPLMYVVQYQWLAILSFTDDCILSFEKLVETVFPLSTCLFDKIDKLVYAAEVMPGSFDEELNRFLVIMHRIPFLDWALIQIMWWLYGDHTEERDIMIDMNSNTRNNVTESADNANCASQEAAFVYCPPQEKVFEDEKPESNAELPALAKSENKEKYNVENEVKTDNAKYNVEDQSRNWISAPLVDFSQQFVDHVQLPSTAASLDRSSRERRKSVDHVQLPRTAAPTGRSSQDRRKSVGHVEFPSTADPLGDSSQEKRISVDHVQLPSTAASLYRSSQDRRKSVDHVQLPRTAAPTGRSSQDRRKSVGHVEFPSSADPPGDSSQEKRISVDHVQLPGTAAYLDKSSQERRKSVDHVQLPRTEAPIGSSFQDRRKSVGHTEFPSIANPPGDSSQEKRISVDHVQFPSTAKKEELPHNKILEDDTFQDKSKSVRVKLETDTVKGAEKKTSGKQTEAENTQERAQQSSVSKEKVGNGRDKEKGTQQSVEDKDPVLELFESRWHL